MRIKTARMILKSLYEKQAGITAPLVAGLTVAALAGGAKKAVNKSREYQAGFIPGIGAHRSSE